MKWFNSQRAIGHVLMALTVMVVMSVGLPVLAGAMQMQTAELTGIQPIERSWGETLLLTLSLLAIGGVVTSDMLQGAMTGFKALYQSAFSSVKPQWQRIAMEAPSTTDAETYNWLGAVPAVKEWLDTKVAAGLLSHNFTIRNKDWEATLEVDRNTFEDDKLGIVRPRIQEMGQEAARHPDELISDLIKANGLCYDGQNFFDTDHAEGSSGTQANTAAGTGTTIAQVTADFRAARAAMITRKDDRGKPLLKNLGSDATGAAPGLFVVMCPADLLGVFEELMVATQIGNTTNVLKGAFSLWVNPYLTDANDWYLFYVGSPIMPLILQMRKRPDFVSLQDPNSSEVVFFRKKFYYGVEARYNGGYGLWQFAHRITNT